MSNGDDEDPEPPADSAEADGGVRNVAPQRGPCGSWREQRFSAKGTGNDEITRNCSHELP